MDEKRKKLVNEPLYKEYQALKKYLKQNYISENTRKTWVLNRIFELKNWLRYRLWDIFH